MIVTFGKQKGGVGSSTVAANLAAVFASRGRSVRVLDCDGQHSIHAWSLLGEGPTLLSKVVEPVDTDRPSEFRAILDRAAASADVVIIDCAPGFNPLVYAAIKKADIAIVPCTPSGLDIEPTADALEVAHEARDGRPHLAVLPSRTFPRTRMGKELPRVLAELGAPYKAIVLPAITHRVACAESIFAGQTVLEYEPDGEAAKEFYALADAIEGVLRGEG